MKLKTVSYKQHCGEPSEWVLGDLILKDVNLLVGKNACGKSKTLNLIMNFAKLLAGRIAMTFTSGDYQVIFEHAGKPLSYTLSYRDAKITKETFVQDEKELLSRGSGGIGRLYAQKMGDYIDFQSPENQLAAVARQDTIQHPFFEPLIEWAKNLQHYAFGTSMGKDCFVIDDPSMTLDQTIQAVKGDTSKVVVGIYIAGEKRHGASFKEAILNDMATIGYSLTDIVARGPTSLTVSGLNADRFRCLTVKEADLPSLTDQNDMSQGMFRALSIIIQLNFALRSFRPSCVLVDDIGEGLDFERSCCLIKLLMKKVENTPIQLIMATNDRFVMNVVPLEFWSLLRREGSHLRIYNHENAKKQFDDFAFTGLNNFDFLATDFVGGKGLQNEWDGHLC